MHFKYAKFDFSESILTPKNPSRLPENDQPLKKTLFTNFKFRGTSFSEIMPNFCRPSFQNKENTFGTLIFSIKPS